LKEQLLLMLITIGIIIKITITITITMIITIIITITCTHATISAALNSSGDSPETKTLLSFAVLGSQFDVCGLQRGLWFAVCA